MAGHHVAETGSSAPESAASESADTGLADSGLALDADEADAVAAAARGYAAALPPERAEPYEALAEAAADGRIPEGVIDAAQRVIAVRLQAGRGVEKGGAATIRLLTAVYRRTPAGRALADRMTEVNQALSALGERRLRSARVAASTPGSYTLTLEAEGGTVSLTIDGAGIDVRSLNVG